MTAVTNAPNSANAATKTVPFSHREAEGVGVRFSVTAIVVGVDAAGTGERTTVAEAGALADVAETEAAEVGVDGDAGIDVTILHCHSAVRPTGFSKRLVIAVARVIRSAAGT